MPDRLQRCRRYSASYVMVSAGTSGAFLAVVYLLSDALQHPLFVKLSEPFLWLGPEQHHRCVLFPLAPVQASHTFEDECLFSGLSFLCGRSRQSQEAFVQRLRPADAHPCLCEGCDEHCMFSCEIEL